MTIEKVYRKDLGEYRWKIDITINRKRIRRADFETKKEAIDAIAAMHTIERGRRYGLVTPQPKVTLKQLYDNASKDQGLKNKPQTLRIFKEFMGLIETGMSLVSLTKADWKKYVDVLRDRDCKPKTINRYMAEVSSMLSSASERFSDLSEWRPPKAPWLPEPPGRNRLLSKDEIAKLLDALKAPRQPREHDRSVKIRLIVRDLFHLMLLTAAREGEILNITPKQINWDWKTITIIATKTKTKRVIPLCDTALEILKWRSPDLFKGLNDNRLYTALARAAQISGVEYGDRIDGGWVLYDLRHVAATVIENSGIPYSAVSAILGHKRTDQTATYTHADLPTMRRGIEALETWCREIDGFFSTFAQIDTPATTMPQQAFG